MFRFMQKTLLLWFCLALGSLAMAQNSPQQQSTEPITDEELKTFIATSQKIQALNQNLQQQMSTTIQAEGMEVTRFQEIQQQMQAAGTGAGGEMPDISEEEKATFQQIMQKLQAMQMQAQQQMMQDMQSEGINVERYREIGMALQSSQDLQDRLQKMQKSMQEMDE